MKLTRLLIIFLLASKATAFLPQYYQTAHTNPGEGSITTSVSGGYAGAGFWGWDHGVGLDIQLAGRYSAESWSNLALFGYFGGIFNTANAGFFVLDLNEKPNIFAFPNGGFGLHWQVREKNTPLAFQLSAEFPTLLSLGLILGFKSKKLNREIVSVGLKSLVLLLPGTLFVNVHPTERLHIAIGASTIYYGLEVHAGLAYTFGRLGRKNEVD